MIHKTAIVNKKAKILDNVEIGPYCIIGPEVEIGNNSVLHSHVNIVGNTKIGENNQIYPFSSIGTPPQDLKYKGEKNSLVIGNDNRFREYVNINLFEENETIIEADVWLGNKSIIDLITKNDVNFILHKRNINNYSAKVIYNNPLPAPINTDTEYGKLIIQNTFKGDLEYPLYAKESIKKAGVFKKISSALSFFIFGGYAE